MLATTKIIGVIPARYASTRFPGKLLAPLRGRPVIQWVVEQATRAQCLSAVIVATDDPRIGRVAEAAGAQVVMTNPDHPSGTDRVAEAAARTGADIVINVQGDEPLIDHELIHRIGRLLAEDRSWDMATAAAPLREPDDIRSPNVVKVVVGREGRALYFSRAAVPYDRDGGYPLDGPEPLYWRHIGLYGYQSEFLQRIVSAPPSRLEQVEKLEQLRALDLGCRMKVIATEHDGVGIDTPDDLARVEAILDARERSGGLAPRTGVGSAWGS